MVSSEEVRYGTLGVDFKNLNIGDVHPINLPDGSKAFLRRGPDSTIECVVNQEGALESMVVFELPVENESGLGYQRSDLLYLKSHHTRAEVILAGLQQDIRKSLGKNAHIVWL